MDVKCKNCGKEYLLAEGDSPENYQCECGGNLENQNENTQGQNTRPIPEYQKTTGSSSNRNVSYGTQEIKSPILAVILSFLIPGLGQFYNGQGEKGIIFFVAAIISAFLIFFFIGSILYLIVWVFAIYDAYDSADRINKGKTVKVKIQEYF